MRTQYRTILTIAAIAAMLGTAACSQEATYEPAADSTVGVLESETPEAAEPVVESEPAESVVTDTSLEALPETDPATDALTDEAAGDAVAPEDALPVEDTSTL